MDKNIGKIVGDYKIVSYSKNEKNVTLYECQCLICNHKRYMRIGDFNRSSNKHSSSFCREDYFKYDFNNNRDDDYSFEGDSGQRTNKDNNTLYKLKCKKCGNIKLATSDELNRNHYYHNFHNCGESVYNERSGMIFEDTQIDSFIKKNEGNRDLIYKCHCIVCGREKIMRYGNMYQHKGTSHHNCSKQVLNMPYVECFRKKWCDMRGRTTNPLNDHYKQYGGRGITSDDYINYIDFYDDMYESFIKHVNKHGIENTTLERIDVNKSYTKDNIRWATREEQSDNFQRTTYFKVIQPDGTYSIERNVNKYEREHGFTHNFIRNRLFGIVKTNSFNGIVYELINKEDIDYEIFAS